MSKGQTVKRISSVFVAILLTVVLLIVAFLVWAHSPYRGEREASLEVWNNKEITVSADDNAIVLKPEGEKVTEAFAFYPGALVDPYAYMYKLSSIVTEHNTAVVIIKPTLNLAIFDTKSWQSITSYVPEAKTWSIGGHSLGGTKACMVLGQEKEISQLVLMGSYCVNDLSGTKTKINTIIGENDEIATQEEVMKRNSSFYIEGNYYILEDFNHASFGDYGKQAGDGETPLTDAEAKAELDDALASIFE